MKKHPFFLLLTTILVAGCVEVPPTEGTCKDNYGQTLNGSIVSYTDTIYELTSDSAQALRQDIDMIEKVEYNDQGLISHIVQSNADGGIFADITREYDDQGRLICETSRDGDEKSRSGSFSTTTFEYEDGQLVSSTLVSGREQPDTTIFDTKKYQTVYSYNGQMLKRTDTYLQDYETSSRLSKTEMSVYTYHVDGSYGVITEDIEEEPDTTYASYDKYGNLVRSIKSDITSTYEYELPSSLMTRVCDKGERKGVISYQSDKHDNWIEQLTRYVYDDDQRVAWKLVTRSIVYKQ